MKWAFYVLIGAAMISCRKSPQSVDPCKASEPFSIDIIIDEFGGDSLTIDTDSVIINNAVTLRAIFPKGYFPKLTWKVGDFQEYTEREVPLRFFRPGVESGLKIPIQLIAEAPANSCFPSGKTRDTAYRLLHVIDMKDSKIIGRYKGLFGNDNSRKDTQTVEVKWYPPDNVFIDGVTSVINLQKGCNTFPSNPNNKYWYMVETNGSMGNNFRFFPTQNSFENGCLAPLAYMKLKPNDKDSLIVDYFYSQSVSQLNPRKQDQFRGKRIR